MQRALALCFYACRCPGTPAHFRAACIISHVTAAAGGA
ncbi:hypothetical protein RHECNPAF_25300108 [Rhizobium etli CNPAF512]|nr:hypothetical protein RHECNPAF_25300108 [Rhizobium etli CNPAF512]